MSLPARKTQSRAGPPGDSIATSNETSYAFLGVRRPSWMTACDPAALATARGDGLATSDSPTMPPRTQPSRKAKAYRSASRGASSPSVDSGPRQRAASPPKRQHENVGPSAAPVLPSPVLSSESSPAATTPVPTEASSGSTSSGNDSAVETQQPLASTVRGASPTHAQARAPSPTSGNDVSLVEPAAEAPDQAHASRESSHVAEQTAETNLATAAPAPRAAVGSVSNVLPNPRPQHSDQPDARSVATKRSAHHLDVTEGEPIPAVEDGDDASCRQRKRSRQCDPPQQAVDPVPYSVELVQIQWFQIVRHRLQAFPGGLESPPRFLEQARYKLLSDACIKCDAFFIILHQLFCLWSIDRECAYAILEPNRQLIDTSFETLAFAMKSNSERHPGHLRWLASFPVAAGDGLYALRQQAPHVFEQINAFLQHFALGWRLFFAKIDERKYPFLVSELQDILKCASPVLQHVLFNLSRRRLGIHLGEATRALEHLFTIDRNNESRKDIDTSEVARMRIAMADKYRAVIHRARGPPLTSMHDYVQRPSDIQGVPMAPYRTQPSAVSQSQTSGALRIQSPHMGFQGAADSSPRPSGPTVEARFELRSDDAENTRGQSHNNTVAVALPWSMPSPLLSNSLPNHPHPMSVRQQAAFPPSPVATGQPFSQAPTRPVQAPTRPVQTWSPMPQNETTPGLAVQYMTPGALANGQMAQQPGPPMAFYGAGPYPQQAISIPQQPMPQWPSTAIRPGQAPINYVYPQRPLPIAQQPIQQWQSMAANPSQAPISYQNPPQRHPARPSHCSNAHARTAATLTRSQHSTTPLNGNQYPQNDVASVQNSLHLLSFRSPKRVAAEPRSTRFYQFLTHFALEPKAVPPQAGLRVFQFHVSHDELSKIVLTSSSNGLPTAWYRSGSVRYRLRVCKQDQGTMKVQAADWATCPGFWPPHIFLVCNDQPVYARRRQHFQQDLPIELTDLLRPGANTIEISLPGAAANFDTVSTYFMGVEVITTLDYEAVRSMVEANQHIGATETKREIERRLKPADDDVVVENEIIHVSVTDPFSSCLFATPVRGVKCKHIECFDLEIWLQTRPHKPPVGQGGPSLVDSWKCPICGLDARPVSLRVDDFFAEIRRKLLEDGCSGTKRISISSDGSWSPVEERDEIDDDGPPAPRVSVPPRTERTPNAIIVLDDD